jgi:starch synthase (maltosyl-transferring)
MEMSQEISFYHRRRIVIENVSPLIGAGRYPIKRVSGEAIVIEADIFRDGHDVLRAEVCFRPEHLRSTWSRVPLEPLENDRWRGVFTLPEPGDYIYVVHAWTDEWESWLRPLLKKIEAKQEVASELLEGADIVRRAAKNSPHEHRKQLHQFSEKLAKASPEVALDLFEQKQFLAWVKSSQARVHETESEKYRVQVDRVTARFAAWYEMFPRSQGTVPGQSGTFDDCIRRLPDIQRMGFDVIYLPPIHPIGRAFRKGKNNSLVAGVGDPGSPWAIGNEHGGHVATEPSLGTLDDFKRFVAAAHAHGIEIALDFAIQCSPDHPYVIHHKKWFKQRPDGTIKYAENPPKKYQDIYPIDFDSSEWKKLWEEWRKVLLFWIKQGVRTFRVDNPHTKPVHFWEWLIRAIRKDHPDVLFLAEAFTRPKMMKVLAKVGFALSYTYFTWRNHKHDLTEYLTELTHSEMAEYYCGNLFANTPDILHEYLQKGGRPAFEVRLLLAATLSSVYGIYSGFEFSENLPAHPGSEEYLDSEKYEIKVRDWDRVGNLKEMIGRINATRKAHPALQLYRNLRFHGTSNDQLLCYSKSTPDHGDVILVVVNLDPMNVQDGNVFLNLHELGLHGEEAFQVHDVLSGQAWTWRGSQNWVRLVPGERAGHLFVVSREV